MKCDHCLNTLDSTVPEVVWRPAHEDYGPLFRLLRGRRWVLTEHAVVVSPNSTALVRANVFSTDEGGQLVAPLVGRQRTLAATPRLAATVVSVRLSLPASMEVADVVIWTPGDDTPAPVAWWVERRRKGAPAAQIVLDSVPLDLGDECAMVVVRCAASSEEGGTGSLSSTGP